MDEELLAHLAVDGRATNFVGGTDDFLVHVAVPGSSELRRFVVDHLSARRSVASTRTSVIFEYHRNVVAAPFE
ncbi:Lrp/AsnC ligand binding domain-containing protein [Kribbella lupini]|uniref:Transcription regulator AsnC/Lrp ligand binding domain-containing protein n=1 Tax=Kribbella lupini TaxID=291602 RepID=A0ABP4NCK6_9ACTN